MSFKFNWVGLASQSRDQWEDLTTALTALTSQPQNGRRVAPQPLCSKPSVFASRVRVVMPELTDLSATVVQVHKSFCDE